MPLKDLQEHLQSHNQWLPLRPPFFKDSSTVGRLVALAACGPERLLYGAPRDLLLGLRYINGAGQLISAGGRVVKNVAGYDITRLMTGSAGSLGFVTDATWRVSTMPERCTAVTAEGTLDACAAGASEILKSHCQPVFVVGLPAAISSDAPDSNRWKLVAGFEGFSQTVDYQMQTCGAILKQRRMEMGPQADYPLHAGKFAEAYAGIADSRFILRGDFHLNRLTDLIGDLNGGLSGVKLFLDFGCGRILAGFDALDGARWEKICLQAREREGHVLLEKAPEEFKKDADVFGLSEPSWKIMHRIKKELDPDSVFAAGRLPGKV
jgi:FAD/FMN-containing dehydrogenase